MMTEPFPGDLDELPEPCTVSVRCTGWAERRHDIVIERDWTVRTPHDLEADRIAAALGGQRHSCLSIARAVDRARVVFDRQDRRTALPARCPSEAPIAFAAESRHHASTYGPTVLGLVQSIRLQVGDSAASPELTESAARILLETDSIEILWDAGVHPRHVVAWWESVGRPDGRVSAYDLLAHMASRDGFPAFVHTGPQPRAVPDLLTDGVVVPSVVRSLVDDPAFVEQCAQIVAAPRPDHSPASTVPGCTLLVPEVVPPARLFIDRSRPGQQAAARIGTRQASSDIVDGVRLVAVRRAHDRESPLLLFAVSDAVEVPRNPVDDADPLYRLSRDLLEAAFVETRNARLRQLNRFAEWMHEAGEYAESVIWLLDTYRRQPANPWSVSQLMTVFAMALRGCLPTRDTPRVLETVGRLLTRDAPEIWGLPTHFGECELLETDPVDDLVDLDLLHSRTEVWMRSIFREMHPHDDGAALAASVTVDRREHDIQCAWGPTVVTFAYRRSGTADPTWIAESPPSARAHLMHAALLLAFDEITGVPTPLPPVPADYSDTTARSAFIRELFDVRALRRLSSVRGTHF